MKKLEGDAYLSDEGELYITVPGERDPFAPPNSPDPEPVKKATGFTFEDVPTYGWPLGVFYKNNPLHFATLETAEAIRRLAQGALPKDHTVSLAVDSIKVGPFTRADIRTVRVEDGSGWVAVFNAGEQANQYARDPRGWRARLLDAMKTEKAKREAED